MRASLEVMELVNGRLFDPESYERSELLPGSFAGKSGYCVVVWSSKVDDDLVPELHGPFPSLDLAFRAAKELG
jgi:hypothetical protein